MTTAQVLARADGPTRRRHGSVGVPRSLLRSLLRALGHVLAVVVIVGICSALALGVLVPRVGGATPFTILTGSMRPHLPPGTLVVVRPVRPSAIRVGTVITYQLRSGRPEVVTHRVVALGRAADGSVRWRTQGDANPVPDPDWVRPAQVRGALWYSVPLLGRINLWVTRDQRRTATVVVAAALLAYAAWMLLGALRDRVAR